MNKVTNFKKNPFTSVIQKFFSNNTASAVPFPTIGVPLAYNYSRLKKKSISPKIRKGRKFKCP